MKSLLKAFTLGTALAIVASTPASATGSVLFSTPIVTGYDAPALNLARGDVDGDGRVDLVQVVRAEGSFTRLTVSSLTSNGTATLKRQYDISSLAPFGIVSLAIADLNRDGYRDVVVGGRSGAQIFTQSKGVLVPGPTFGSWDVNSIIAADIDRDGVVDLAAGSGDGVHFWKHAVVREAPRVLSSTYATELFLGNFNGDWRPDLVVNNGKSVSVITQKLGGFNAEQTVSLPNSYFRSVAVGNLAGDGKVEILASNGTSAATLIRGEGNYVKHQTIDVANGRVMTIADINADGTNDIIAGNSVYNYNIKQHVTTWTVSTRQEPARNTDGSFPTTSTFAKSATLHTRGASDKALVAPVVGAAKRDLLLVGQHRLTIVPQV